MRGKAFSLVELVVVVVILGIIAAIAIPRFSHAADGAAESAMKADLQTLRTAIDLYSIDHGGKPPTALHALG